MTTPSSPAWRCLVCGYVHTQSEPPDLCPVCGAAAADFEPFTPAESPATAQPSPQQWQCLNCQYLHAGTEPPATCPVCGVDRDSFEPAAAPAAPSETAGAPLRLVIVGGGIAGVTAAETARRIAPAAPITLVGLEGEWPYYRLNLTRYLAGEIGRDTLPLHPPAWYAEQRIEVISPSQVDQILPDRHEALLADGRRLPYDRLILAGGSHPSIPPLDGIHLDGVFTLRTASDADRLMARAQAGARCVCIGGGILGIETAGALARQKADVTLLESHGWLMPRQLNPRAAGVLERHLQSLGIRVVKNARSRAILGDGRVTGVALQDGSSLPADLVLLATGVRPNTALARKTGLAVNTGILVDQYLRTSQPDIYAAGDAAEFNGQVYGAWAAAQFQGSIAALNALGLPTPFGGLPRSNTVKALGLDLTSIGQFLPDDGSYQVIEEETPGAYRSFVVHDGRLVGAILIGHATLAAPVKKAIESGLSLGDLLRRSPTAAELAAQITGA